MDNSGDILVVGLGRSGEAAARYLAQRVGLDGIRSVTVVDEARTEDLEERAEPLRAMNVDVRLGVTDVDGSYDFAVVSPGLSPGRPLMRSTAERAARMVSEIEFAFERSRSPWIAVTGTNGKTTTTSLISHLLVGAGIPAETVGNIGRPAIEVIEGASAVTAIVAEVSSFQLAFTDRFRPRVSVFLNLTPDHIDWHGSMELYAADKAKIFANQGAEDFAVIDVDDEGSAPYADAAERQGIRVLRVTRSMPAADGAGVVGGKLVIKTQHGLTELLAGSELQVRGEHNVSNALAAAAAAHAFGAHPDDISKSLRTFAPIPHRLEPVGDVGGVEYFNDSKATNPDAVLKALTAFAERPVVVLLGGRNKRSDFSELAAAVARQAKAVVLFGEARSELARAFADTPATVLTTVGMANAVSEAARIASPGDAVLLSPACASFDEFSGFEERGDTFRRLVAERVAAGGVLTSGEGAA